MGQDWKSTWGASYSPLDTATVTPAPPALSPRASAWSSLRPDGNADGDDVVAVAVVPDNDAAVAPGRWPVLAVAAAVDEAGDARAAGIEPVVAVAAVVVRVLAAVVVEDVVEVAVVGTCSWAGAGGAELSFLEPGGTSELLPLEWSLWSLELCKHKAWQLSMLLD